MNVALFAFICSSLSIFSSHGRHLDELPIKKLKRFSKTSLQRFYSPRGGHSNTTGLTERHLPSEIEEGEAETLSIPSNPSSSVVADFTSEFNWNSAENYTCNSNSTPIITTRQDPFLLGDPSLICVDLRNSTTPFIGIEVSKGIESNNTESLAATPMVDHHQDQIVSVSTEPMYTDNIQPKTLLPTFSGSSTQVSMEILKNNDMLRSLTTTKVLRLVWYYFLLYFFTVVYNVANKKVLEFLPLPATVSAVQTLIGIPLFLPLWMLKSPRHLDTIDRSSLMKIALCHGLGNLATVYALQSGTVSFTHVIKSAEPLFTAILSIVIMKSSLSTAVYLSLLPIVFGVALASAKELSFSWFGFFAAMLSNFFYQLRMVLSKVSFNGTDDNKLSAANTFRVITIFSFIQLIPIALVLEGNQIIPAFYSMISHPEGLKFTLVNLLIAGGSFYFYNEVGFWILDLVHPVTHAVGNTIKRVVLVLASIIIFRNPVNNMGLIGSSIAIMGSFLYALASQKK